MKQRDWAFVERPSHCVNGHLLGPGRVLVGFEPCRCTPTVAGGHTLWHCKVCYATACWPPHDPDYVAYPEAGEAFRDGQ